jgi:hypothetical protein
METLRVSQFYFNEVCTVQMCGRAMSEKIYKQWVDRMKGFLECD